MLRCSAGSRCRSGSAWGLFRHYWVVLKLLITAFATVILLIYMGTFRQMAGIAADPIVDLEAVRNASPIVHSILAIILLIAATVLGVYKPFGMTRYGTRRCEAQRRAITSATLTSGPAVAVDPATAAQWRYFFVIIAIGFVLLFVVLHFMGLRH